jgi:hypothetical protein
MYYIILIGYYIFGIIFFIANDFNSSRRDKDLHNSELLEELL